MIETIRTVSTNSIAYQNLAYGNNGNLYVSWTEEEASNDIDVFFAERNSLGVWSVEKITDTVGGDREPEITLDSSNVPHVVWQNLGGLAQVKYATKNGNLWDITTFSHNSVDCWFSSICIDDNDSPHLSWIEGDGFNGYTIKYANKTSTQWTNQSLLALDDSERPEYSKMIIDNNGNLYLFWREKYGTNGNRIGYMIFDGVTWSEPIRFGDYSGLGFLKFDVAFTTKQCHIQTRYLHLIS